MTSLSKPTGGETSTAAVSQAEIIQALSNADVVRLHKIALMTIAEPYARMTPYDPADLLDEAITRVLDGRRVWPRGVPVRSFLPGVMRSIAWEWRSQLHGPLHDGLPDPKTGDPEDSIYIAMVIAMFGDDPVAQRIVIGMMEGARGDELQRFSRLGDVEYASKRRKIRRRIEQLLADEKSS